MKSFDTNILFYSLNQDAPESESALRLNRRALDTQEEWIVADQVYFEFYRLIRNPSVIDRPLTGNQPFEVIDYYRNKNGWLKCAYNVPFWEDMVPYLETAVDEWTLLL